MFTLYMYLCQAHIIFPMANGSTDLSQLEDADLCENVLVVYLYHQFNCSFIVKLFQTAWAQGTGMRESNYKDAWDVDAGAMYIPWNKLPPDMSVFLDGSIIDADSLPENLKGWFKLIVFSGMYVPGRLITFFS